MEAFKGKFERTSAEKYEEMLKVIIMKFSYIRNTDHLSLGAGGELPPEEGCYSLHPRYADKDM